jgi:GT2 family glycosyltransferase
VIFLLYNAEKMVPALLEAARKQKHPKYARQEEWLEVLVMDDRSRDGTANAVRSGIEKLGFPPHFRFVPNETNLGLSKTLNKSFQLAKAPFGLTCHCDVLFGREDYVASMLELLESRTDAAAVTGQPTPMPGKRLPLAEKVNLIANLMDIFPISETRELIPVGFAEGRCDAFRIEALRKVGFYDVTLRLAGEDQVLAARLREQGYQVYQAPWLPYYLSVSGSQDTLGKLIEHQRLFGRAHPYILLRSRGTGAGLVGSSAGSNRQSRTLLRVSQLGAAAVYVLAPVAALLGPPGAGLAAAGALGLVFLVKMALFFRHFRAIPLGPLEFLVFFALQPLLDFSYSFGLLQGLLLLTRGSEAKPIS